MKSKTRYVVIASLLTLGVGLGTGLVAYYVGLPQSMLGQSGPRELQYVPADAAVVAYANVRGVMNSGVRKRLQKAFPLAENGRARFQDITGIDVERDVDRMVAYSGPEVGVNAKGLLLARGRFDAVRIESLMRDRGADVEVYKGARLIVADAGASGDRMALSFLEPGLAAVGSAGTVRAALDRRTANESITGNGEMMRLVRDVDSADAWVVGRFDVLRTDGRLPAEADQIPPITWFSVSARVDEGVRGVVRADARDDASAGSLRDMLRGFVAFAKLEAASRPEFKGVVESLELSGSGRSIALSFDVPSEAFEAIGRTLPR